MDIQEVARLHTRYAEPPLTIEMQSHDGASPMLEGPAATPTSTPMPFWKRLSDIQRQTIGVLVVTAIAFPIGMWTASGSKHDSAQPAASKVPATSEAAAAAGASDAQSHEWPPRNAKSDAAVPISQGVSSSSPTAERGAVAVAAPAVSGAPAASAPIAPTPPVAVTQPSKPAAKAPVSAVAKPAPANVPANAGQTSHSMDTRRSNEIKLF